MPQAPGSRLQAENPGEKPRLPTNCTATSRRWPTKLGVPDQSTRDDPRTTYKTLQVLLFQLVIDTKRDASPLFPTLERIAAHPGYDPDGMRQFELIRTYSLRLLARGRRPIVKETLVRLLDAFPERVDRESGSMYLYALAEIALDLGDKTLAPRFEPFFERMLPEHSAKQRENALGLTRLLVAKLAKKR